MVIRGNITLGFWVIFHLNVSRVYEFGARNNDVDVFKGVVIAGNGSIKAG